MKKLIGILAIVGFLGYGVSQTLGAFGDPFISLQVGTSPTNGYVLKTNGTNSTWVDPNSLGITATSPYEIATTSSISVSNLAYFTKTGGRTTLGGVATTSVTCAGTASCTGFDVLGSSPITITGSGLSSYDAFTHVSVFGQTTSATSTLLALTGSTYSLVASSSVRFGTAGADLYYDATNNRLGIGTTTPGTTFSLGGNGTGINLLDGTTATSTFSGHVRVKGNLEVDGNAIIDTTLRASALSSALLQVNGAGDVGEYAGTSCTNQFPRSLSALGAATCASVSLANDITGTLGITNGGTGTTTTATGYAAYWGTTTMRGVATTTISAGNGLSFSGTAGALLGGTALTVMNPFSIATTSTVAAPQLAYFTVAGGRTTLGSVATSSPTCSGILSCTNAVTITSASGATTLSATYDAFTHLAGSATTSAFGIGTTTPFSQLSVSTSTQSSSLTSLFAVASTTNATLFNVLGGGNVGISTTSPPSLFSIGNALTNGGLYFNTTGLGIGSSSPSNSFSLGQATKGFFISSLGKIFGTDTANSWEGRITPTRTFVLSAATTTTWTATTSNAYAYSTALTLPFTGVLRNVQCTASSTGAFLRVQPFINQTATTPKSFVASTTVGTVPFTGGNTFSKGDTLLMYVGTSTAHSALGVNCIFNATESP